MEQIIAEYKVKALRYHPDKNEGNKDAEIKFQKLNVSFNILMKFLCNFNGYY